MTDKVVILTTVSSEKEGHAISRALVEHRVAACVNLITGVRSVYYWKDEVCQETEHLLLIKTKEALQGKVADLIRSLHSYECPEIISLPVSWGWEGYLQWIEETVSEK